MLRVPSGILKETDNNDQNGGLKQVHMHEWIENVVEYLVARRTRQF